MIDKKSLNEVQFMFTKSIASLIDFAYNQGYTLTFADAYRDPRVFGELGTKKGYGISNSNHKRRLAVDFNVFVKGRYVTRANHPCWGKLHKYWRLLGGSKAIVGDNNHFSFEYNGNI